MNSSIAAIDLELAEIVDDELRDLYLEEALQFLEYSQAEHLQSDNYGYAALDQAKIATVKIELSRSQATGTGLLTTRFDPEKYTELELSVGLELSTLEETITSSIDKILDIIDAQGDTSDQVDKTSRDNLAILFEVATYYSLLEEIVEKKALTTAKVRLGSLRQEKGSTHKIITENDTESRQNSSGFNFNYDVEYSQLNDREKVKGEGLYTTVYIQNRLNPDSADPKTAKEYSQRFIAGKEFRFITPANLMHLVQPPEIKSQKQAMIFFAHELKDFISSQDTSGLFPISVI